MEKDFNIQEELKILAPTLASMERKNPFKVPQGYFENNVDAASLVVNDKDVEIPSVIAKSIAQNPFKTPEGYFKNNLNSLSYIIGDTETTSAIIDKFANASVLKVPQGYFENNLAALSCIWKDAAIKSDIIDKAGKATFKVPQGYFEGLSERILENVKAANQEEVGTNFATPKMSVPNDYFSNLSSRVMERIKIEESTEEPVALEHLKDDSAYMVPDGYFANLSSRLMESVNAADTEKEEAIALEYLKDDKAYTVPKNYFETLPQRILKNVKESEQKGKVIQMQPEQKVSNGRSRILRILTSVAAMFLLFMVAKTILTPEADGAQPPIAEPLADGPTFKEKLSNLSNADLQKYLNAEDIEEAMLIEELDKEGDIFTLSKDLDMDEIKAYLLKELTDEDLKDII